MQDQEVAPYLRDLVQLEYDLVSFEGYPAWLQEKARNRYFEIMGAYCDTNYCGKCKLYSVPCERLFDDAESEFD
jgi:hypothetical protein